jgi:conjugative transfer signal peptidase TraF
MTARAMMLIVASVAISALFMSKMPCLIWNATASAPIGLYAVSDVVTLQRGDLVLAEPPAWARRLASERGYLPLHVPLVKRVVALRGDCVCGVVNRITINGRTVAMRRTTDSKGRPLPAWQGCRLLGTGAVFLLMPDVASSFDGRYFGPVSRGAILGKLRPLWLP